MRVTPLYLSFFCVSFLPQSCKLSQTDYYAQLVQVCPEPASLSQATIPTGCQQALEQMLPFDASFDSAAADRKQGIVEAFYYLLYAPMHYPKNNQIMDQGAFTVPLEYICLLTPEQDPSGCQRPELQGKVPNPNRALVNYILNSVSNFTYDPTSSGGTRLATYQAGGTIVFTDRFWDDFSQDAWYVRAAILAHESRHAHASWHIYCGDDRGFSCDSDFTGAYGMEAVVAEMLLHGADEDAPRQLTDSQMKELSEFVCTRMTHVLSTSQQFDLQIQPVGCPNLPLSFFSQIENLVSVPESSSEAPVLVTSPNPTIPVIHKFAEE